MVCIGEKTTFAPAASAARFWPARELAERLCSWASWRAAVVAATAGYMAFLAGPPALGFVGQAWGLLNMFYLLVACLVVVLLFSWSAGSERKTSAATPLEL